MKKLAFLLVLILPLTGKALAGAEGPTAHSLFVSQQTFELIQRLAKEKKVLADIQDQNSRLTDEGQVLEIQNLWRQSAEASALVRAFREKASCQAMRDCFSKEISMVDCFTLDAKGRVVGTLYKPQDFLQEGDPCFTQCFNHGRGQVYVNEPLPTDPKAPVEISMPVMEGSRTVGVLVATVLPER